MVSSTRRLRLGGVDLEATLQPIGVYPGDPTHRRYPRGFAKAVLTPDGPATMRLTWDAGGSSGRGADRVEAEAWGPGASWVLDRAGRWVGLDDDLDGFDPDLHPRVAQWWRRHGDFRLGGSGVVWQELALSLLGQRVTTEEAVRSWGRLCRTWGGPAPGPDELLLPPDPAALAGASYVDLHRMNVDRRRADVLLRAARRSDRLEEAAAMDAPGAIARLTALSGIGIWTATSTLASSHGDPDTIVLRDYGLPTLVNYAFTGETRRLPPDDGGDEVMCELLEPWRGHRQRIIRLLFAAGVRAPRRGPKSWNPDIRRL